MPALGRKKAAPAATITENGNDDATAVAATSNAPAAKKSKAALVEKKAKAAAAAEVFLASRPQRTRAPVVYNELPKKPKSAEKPEKAESGKTRGRKIKTNDPENEEATETKKSRPGAAADKKKGKAATVATDDLDQQDEEQSEDYAADQDEEPEIEKPQKKAKNTKPKAAAATKEPEPKATKKGTSKKPTEQQQEKVVSTSEPSVEAAAAAPTASSPQTTTETEKTKPKAGTGANGKQTKKGATTAATAAKDSKKKQTAVADSLATDEPSAVPEPTAAAAPVAVTANGKEKKSKETKQKKTKVTSSSVTNRKRKIEDQVSVIGNGNELTSKTTIIPEKLPKITSTQKGDTKKKNKKNTVDIINAIIDTPSPIIISETQIELNVEKPLSNKKQVRRPIKPLMPIEPDYDIGNKKDDNKIVGPSSSLSTATSSLSAPPLVKGKKIIQQKKPLLNEFKSDFTKQDFNKPNSNKPFNLKISTWNVAGLRALTKKGGLDYVTHESPDIFCMQEIKCTADDVPAEAKLKGYHYYWCAKPGGRSGVALYSKIMPYHVEYGIGNKEFDDEGRVITAEYTKYFIVAVYVPNAGRKLVTLPKRLKWDKLFQDYLIQLNKKKPVIICGDMNVSHLEIDLANPKTNRNSAGFTQEERDGMTKMLSLGFVDTFRMIYPDKEKAYTYWTYMANARSRNVGWRLDYFICSERIKSNVVDSVIRSEVMGSDHCPITLFMNF